MEDLEQKQKQKKLAKYENDKLKQLKKKGNEIKENKKGGIGSKIINKITENIEIYIENIHLRFEDFENFFACGATLNSLSLSSQLNDPDSIVNLIKKVTIFFPIFIGQS